MGMNPSNNLDEGLVGFPNLGDPPFCDTRKNTALIELLDAGLPRGCSVFTTQEKEVYKPGTKADQMSRAGIWMPGMEQESETMWIEVHKVSAQMYGWKFYRNWYYWVCAVVENEAVVPEATARVLNLDHYRDVRVDGYAGGKEPDGDVSCYHVDTPLGLKVLVGLLKRTYEEHEAEHEKRLALRFPSPNP